MLLAMEFLLDFILTAAFSFLCSFFLSKLLSGATPDDHGHDFKRRIVHVHDPDHDLSFLAESNDFAWEKERKLGLVSEILGVDELSESVENKLAQREFSCKCVGSCNSLEDAKTSNNQLPKEEIEIIDYLTEEGSEDGAACKCEYYPIDKSQKREIEMELINEELGVDEGEVNCGIGGTKEGLLDEEEDDDWEGVEGSELERLFGAAVAYVGSIDNVDNISSLSTDLKLKFYGLYQVAIEGPCHVPQPMPLKFSARSKWNAWQQLGNMSPEVAMEQYINLLSRNFPGWMKDDFGEDGKQGFADNEATRNLASDLRPSQGHQKGVLVERTK
ncbi:hypothetical protein P3X46_018691 [Hevea brasiliensis]|uniref:ACB domain-containing protein n=1 Tax=Hevea brasiliensis TaxID=3981 RepID=A0ABQ9LRG7_HEVBR|nr:acyl-CoA-binding domain-containing protein 3 isoform X2 [Hevea brasiliensis]KAJ9170594.1 hypothetical protein P3X46_018691 [Hevea brasiliensis]